jgi:anti-sigma factor ChrR (cupin superfamily)
MPHDLATIPAGAQPGVVRRRLTADAPSPASVFVDAPSLPWQPSQFPGVRMKTLYSDPASGVATLLMRLEPGAAIPLHEHMAVEQTYVLEGRFVDEEGECTPGQFVWRPPGNTHVAWAGPEGALILGIFQRPNLFAAAQPGPGAEPVAAP